MRVRTKGKTHRQECVATIYSISVSAYLPCFSSSVCFAAAAPPISLDMRVCGRRRLICVVTLSMFAHHKTLSSLVLLFMVVCWWWYSPSFVSYWWRHLKAWLVSCRICSSAYLFCSSAPPPWLETRHTPLHAAHNMQQMHSDADATRLQTSHLTRWHAVMGGVWYRVLGHVKNAFSADCTSRRSQEVRNSWLQH